MRSPVPEDIFMPQSTSTGDWFAAEPVLEQLGRSDEEGNYVPWLAEKFETDADNLTFTITLRDGVKFSDGSPCDAEAVAWNIQQYVDNGKASEVCNPKSIEVVDEKTVKITFDEWANNWDSAIGAVFISSKRHMMTTAKNGARHMQSAQVHLSWMSLLLIIK